MNGIFSRSSLFMPVRSINNGSRALARLKKHCSRWGSERASERDKDPLEVLVFGLIFMSGTFVEREGRERERQKPNWSACTQSFCGTIAVGKPWGIINWMTNSMWCVSLWLPVTTHCKRPREALGHWIWFFRLLREPCVDFCVREPIVEIPGSRVIVESSGWCHDLNCQARRSFRGDVERDLPFEVRDERLKCCWLEIWVDSPVQRFLASIIQNFMNETVQSFVIVQKNRLDHCWASWFPFMKASRESINLRSWWHELWDDQNISIMTCWTRNSNHSTIISSRLTSEVKTLLKLEASQVHGSERIWRMLRNISTSSSSFASSSPTSTPVNSALAIHSVPAQSSAFGLTYAWIISVRKWISIRLQGPEKSRFYGDHHYGLRLI